MPSLGETVVRLDRVPGTLLSLTAVTGLVTALVAVPASALAATPSASPSVIGGGSQQVIVSLAGSTAVDAPGVHVVALLGGVHAEIVNATAAGLAALASTAGVTGISPNAKAHLESFDFGEGSWKPGNGNWPKPQPKPSDSPSTSPTAPAPSGSDSPPASPTVPASPPVSPSPSDSPAPSSPEPSSPAPSDSPVPSASPSPSASPTPDSAVVAPDSIGGPAGQVGAGSGVTVALIDTGVTDTAALNRASGRLVDAVDTSGLNNAGGKVVENGIFSDGFGHGTFMASLIAGGVVGGSGSLGLGVAPGATIDVVKVADNQGNTSLAAVLAGLNWVATHADTVSIANLSLSVDRPSDAYGIDPLNFAVALTRAAGVTVVVAAGNTAGQVGDPGFAPQALTVGSADTTGTTPSVASFSGSGNVDGVMKPDVVAAGVDILGEMPANTVIGQQYPAARQPSGLFRGSGTSQSTAIVSGLAALYLQAYPNSTPVEVKSAIRSAATSFRSGNSSGWGSSADEGNFGGWGGSGSSAGQGLVALPTRSYGSFNTGEWSLNVFRYDSTASQWGSIFTDGTFDARRWAARRWAGDGWDARRWASGQWAGVTFDARRWAARRWASDGWDARRWAASSWGGTS